MMKTLKYIVLLTVMLVNVTPYIKDGKLEWKANEAAAQFYTIEYDIKRGQYLCGDLENRYAAPFYMNYKCETKKFGICACAYCEVQLANCDDTCKICSALIK
jgi:hypothetical protein